MRKPLHVLTVVARAVAVGLGCAIALMSIEAFWARKRRIVGTLLEPEIKVGLFGGDGESEDRDGEAGVQPLELAMLGDSLAVGFGADDPADTTAVRLANGLAEATNRSVRLRNYAEVGAESKDLAAQMSRLTRSEGRLEVVVIVIGGNEIMHLHRIGASVQYLATAVRELRRRGCHVVVATCPDLGAVRLFVQPLRLLAHILSRLLATAQTIVVLRAGGRTVSLADTLGPAFRRNPQGLFSADRLHPSSLGYARAAEVLLPSVCAAAAFWSGQEVNLPHRIYRHDRRIHRLAWLAFRAARHAGSAARPARGSGKNVVWVTWGKQGGHDLD